MCIHANSIHVTLVVIYIHNLLFFKFTFLKRYLLSGTIEKNGYKRLKLRYTVQFLYASTVDICFYRRVDISSRKSVIDSFTYLLTL
jgi:hypothetical protein